jgi:hypothetical protein
MSGIIGGAGSKSGIIFEPYYAFGYWGNSASSSSVSIASDSKFPATLVEEGGTGSWSDANDRFTCKLSGIYRMTGTWEINATSEGRYGAYIKINAEFDDNRRRFSNSIHEIETTGWDTLTLNTMCRLTAGEYLEFFTETVPTGGMFWQYAQGGFHIQWIGF